MFISRITLRKDFHWGSKFWDLCKDEYGLHQAVWNMFGDTPDRKRDFIYRLEEIGKRSVVYAVSKRRPVDLNGLWDIETKDYDPKLKPDTRLGFTARVNPTRSRDGKRHDVVMDLKYKNRSKNTTKADKKLLAELATETCVNWLKERSEKSGFELLSARADGYRQMRFSKKKDGLPVRYSTVDLTGTLRITNEGNFKKALFEGLGREKSFGCGLMLVRRV